MSPADPAFPPGSARTTSNPSRTVGYGGCGCESPRRHEAGCLWQLDLRRRRRDRDRLVDLERQIAELRAMVDLTAARPGDCVICLGELDQKAIRAHDSRCERCYRLLGQRRRDSLGGDR